MLTNISMIKVKSKNRFLIVLDAIVQEQIDKKKK